MRRIMQTQPPGTPGRAELIRPGRRRPGRSSRAGPRRRCPAGAARPAERRAAKPGRRRRRARLLRGRAGALSLRIVQCFLVAALAWGAVVVVLAAAGPRAPLRSGWFYAGGGIALGLWAPYLAWQGSHGWPELAVARSIAAGASGTSAPWSLILPEQFVLVAWSFSPVESSAEGCSSPVMRVARHQACAERCCWDPSRLSPVAGDGSCPCNRAWTRARRRCSTPGRPGCRPDS